MYIYNFFGAHKGQAGWVVGKGRTTFSYEDFAKIDISEPVFYINDAVLLDKHLKPGHPSYMTFLDYNQRLWAKNQPVKSIVLCPREHQTGTSCNRVVCYNKEPDLSKLAQSAFGYPLFVSRGTVCTLLSFAYLTGVTAINFIGCDGINDCTIDAYDARIPNPSNGRPAWEYDVIRKNQEDLCNRLKLPFQYLGTPQKETPTQSPG